MEFIAGVLAGVILGVILVCSGLDNFEKIRTSENGMFISHKDKVYELIEVKQK